MLTKCRLWCDISLGETWALCSDILFIRYLLISKQNSYRSWIALWLFFTLCLVLLEIFSVIFNLSHLFFLLFLYLRRLDCFFWLFLWLLVVNFFKVLFFVVLFFFLLGLYICWFRRDSGQLLVRFNVSLRL